MKRKIFTQLDAYESSSEEEEPKRKRPPRALPLITVHGERFEVDREAIEFLSSIEGPVAIVALAGKYRTGKSFFLNRVLLQRKGSFQVGGTVNACTKGIWLWSEPITVGNKTVLIMDTEGLGAFNATDTHDSRIFALALLLSTYFIYNSVGTIDESAINALSLVANLSKHICVQSQGQESSAQELGDYFPEFLWLVRDFTLQLVDDHGKAISSQQYLESALADQVQTSDVQSDRNRVRSLLRNYFPKRDCATLVRPCLEEAQLQKLDHLGDKELRGEFQRQAKSLRQRILEKAAPKQALGKPINGLLLAKLAESFVDAINSGAAPAIRDSWSLLAEVQAHKAQQTALSFFQGSLPQLPQDPDLLNSNLANLADRALQVYKDECLEENPIALADLQAQLNQITNQLLRENLQHAERKIASLLDHLELEAIAGPKELEARFRELQDHVRLELGQSEAIALLWARMALQPSWSWFKRLSLETSLRLEQLTAAQASWEAKLADKQSQLIALEAQLSGASQKQLESLQLIEEEKLRSTAALALAQEQHQQELELYRHLVSEADQRCQDLQAAQTTDLGEVDQLRIELEAQKLECADLQQEIDRQRAQLAQITCQLDDQLSQVQDQQLLEQRLAQVNAELQKGEIELTALRSATANQESEFQRQLEKLIRENSASLSEIRRSHEQDHVALQRRLRETETSAAKQAQEHAQALAESQRLQDKACKALELSDQDKALLRKELDERIQHAQKQDQLVSQLRDRFAQELKETHEKYRQDAQKALDERTKLMQQLRELSTSAAVKEVRLETLTSRLAQVSADLEAERKRFDSHKTSIQGAWQSAELKRAETSAFELKQSLAESQARVLALEKQLKDQERESAVSKLKMQMEYEKQSLLQRSSGF